MEPGSSQPSDDDSTRIGPTSAMKMVPNAVLGDALWEFTYLAIAAALVVARIVLVTIEFRLNSLLISPFYFAILVAAWIAARHSGFGATLAASLLLVLIGVAPFVLLADPPHAELFVVLLFFEVWFAVAVALSLHGAANLSSRRILVGAVMQLILVGWGFLVWFVNRDSVDIGPGVVATSATRAVLWSVVVCAALMIQRRSAGEVSL